MSNTIQASAAPNRRGIAVEINPCQCDIFEGNGRALTQFSATANAALIKDVERNGQQTPVIVRQRGERYEVVAGTRRLGSVLDILNRDPTRLLKAIVIDLSDKEAWDLAEKENANRRDLTPLQRARAWSYAISTIHSGRQDLFAESIGEDPSVVSRTLALLKIPQEVMGALRNAEGVSVHFAAQLVPVLQDQDRANAIRATAANLLNLRGPMTGPDLLDALLSTPTEVANRAPVRFALSQTESHSSFKTKRDGTATLSMKSVDAKLHDAKSRKALLAAITLELRKFLLLDTGSLKEPEAGAASNLTDPVLF